MEHVQPTERAWPQRSTLSTVSRLDRGRQRREEKESVMLALKIFGTSEGNEEFELPKVHTVQNLSLPKQTWSIPQMANKLPREIAADIL